MTTIALFANMMKKEALSTAGKICAFLHERGVKVVAKDDDALLLKVPSLSSLKNEKIDFLISLGGDGTILRAIHQFPDLDVPILGVNLGALGFMADIVLDDLWINLEDLLKGAYRIERRIMLEGLTSKKESCFAVNDMVIHRGKNPSLIDLSIHVDGAYFNTFSADGVIVSTPNGSTAYSLAAGGPILTPELEAFVITPISAHTISNRPIVLMPKEKIEITNLSAEDPVDITYDGLSKYTMQTNEVLTLSRSERTFKMVSLARSDYFSTLRTKLGWAGQFRALAANRNKV